MLPKILIVDDEAASRSTLEGFLTGQGYEICTASHGAEGLELARTLRPDLVLLDVMMPEVDGFSVCRLIRKDPEIGRVPIILITALDDDASKLAGLQAGADEFVTKPCSRSELVARVKTIISLNRFRNIAEQRSRFEQLFNTAPVAIVITNAEGRVSHANASAEAMLTPNGSGHLLGTAIATYFEAKAASVLHSSIGAALAGKPVDPVEIRTRHESAARTMHLRVVAVPGDKEPGALLIFSDLTAEVQAREALQNLNANLEQAVRARTTQLEEANTLLMSYANFVSHELRSPLTVVKGYLALMEEGAVPLTDEVRPVVQQAMAAAVLMEESIHNILQLARDEHAGHASRPHAPVDPMPIVQRLVDHLRGSAQHGRTHFEIGALPPIRASAVVLERVLYNLLTNAVKYSAAAAQPRVEIGTLPSRGGSPVIYIRDNGVGFDPREGEKLFHEFSRLSTAAATAGVGIGLSFVSRLVSAHGGRIWADGDPGKGATFYVQFPDGEAPVTKPVVGS